MMFINHDSQLLFKDSEYMRLWQIDYDNWNHIN